MSSLLDSDIALLPLASDVEAAAYNRKRLLESWEHPLEHLYSDRLLEAIFGNSPYLSQLLFKHTSFYKSILEEGIEPVFERILVDVKQADRAEKLHDIMTQLRIAKQKAALLIAIADIARYWDVFAVTQALTRFAEATLAASVNFLLRQAERNGELVLADSNNPGVQSGLIVLALGKLGGKELNYSSDVDLIIFFDPAVPNYHGKRTLQEFFIKLSHELVKIMQERTQDGYVFRMDLRLRPDPASTPVAISTTAALLYYESLGQNWERAAMIKARAIAGDIEAGEAFLKQMIPYVWRKYMDFESIQDIHSIKRQIDSKQGDMPDNLAGYNIKIGHGAIREIEFYAQTQQLIWGGREPLLRLRATCNALQALAKAGKMEQKIADELVQIYIFLRILEHRLQMVADQQTHSLPLEEKALEQIAVFMCYPSLASFIADLRGKLATVKQYYHALFKESPSLGIEGSLVFTGTENDPETLRTIERLGFGNPQAIADVIRGWHHGRYRIMRTKRARELLTELTPVLLEAFSHTAMPDVAFVQFDKFISGLPTGVQIFSLFTAKPQLLDVIAELMGSYPYLAGSLSRKPILLEYVLYPEFLEPFYESDTLADDLQNYVSHAMDYEGKLDEVRRWAHDRQFRVGIQLIKNVITAAQARKALSKIAEAVLVVLLEHVCVEFAEKHGLIPGGECMIVAMGKLGSRQLTFASDIDLVFVYDVPDAEAISDGEEPLTATQYYTRLCRRFLASFTAPTTEGRLYEVDMRLRPSGDNAPIATSLQSFDIYYDASAWTWEYMALTRARVMGKASALSEKVAALIQSKLTTPRAKDTLASDIISMREKIAQQFRTQNIWDIKHVPGGLIDLEFIAQYMQLLHADKHPEVLNTNTFKVFKNLHEAGLLDEDTKDALQKASRLLLDTQTILRLIDGKNFNENTLSPGMKKVFTKAMQAESFEAFREELVSTEQSIQQYFMELIGKSE